MKISLILIVLFASLAAAAQQKIKVACVGNSITEGGDIETGKRYPDQLQAFLGDSYEVRNYGIGGRTLLKKGDFSYWQEQKYKEVLDWAPDVVIIKLGTNDSKPQNWIYSEEFEQDYRAFIQSFKHIKGHRKIFVCTPVPVFQDAYGITATIVQDEIVPIVQKVAKAEGVVVIDLFAALSGKSEMFPDGVHPNADGAKFMAEEIYKVLRQDLARSN
jgi:acyl-CoA thioesterase-1